MNDVDQTQLATERSRAGVRVAARIGACAALLIGFAAIPFACRDYSSSTATAGAEAVPANAVVVEFKVEGLHCHGCAASARNAISRIDGVRRCSVSFDHGSAEVVMDIDDEDAIIAKIVEEVAELGFTIERSESYAH